jgi:2-dehydro-3-deoxygluconokinase
VDLYDRSNVTAPINGISIMRVVCFGEMLLRLGAPGREPLLQTPTLEISTGGAEANVARALAGLGLETAMVTTLPDGPLGDACVAELRRTQVDTSGVLRRPGRLGLYFFTRGALLRPPHVTYDRAGSVFATADPGSYDWPELLQEADWLHVSGITPALSDSVAREVDDALDAAETLGVAVSFDCNFRPSLWRGREREAVAILKSIARRATLVFAGVHDVRLLYGEDFSSLPASSGFALAAKVLFGDSSTLTHVAATARIAHSVDHHEITGLIADRNETATSRVFNLDSIVDRIGSGDAYAAGTLHALCSGLDLEQAVEFAAASCALKHGLPGDCSVVSAEEIWEVVRRHDRDVVR